MKWVKIKGYSDYEISSKGVIRRSRLSSNNEIIYSEVKPFKVGKHRQYLAVNLWHNGERKTHLIHKLYVESFNVSLKDACRIIYDGFNGDPEAKYNINRWLVEKIIECETSSDREFHDEILYLKEFIKLM